MAQESIQAPKPISFLQPRPQKRDEEKPRTVFEFAHWLAEDTTANDKVYSDLRFPVPMMSTEGILILAQAQEEEFALQAEAHPETPAQAYEVTAQKLHEEGITDDGQLEFDFIAPVHSGDVMDKEV